MDKFITFLLLIFIVVGCTSDESEIHERVRESENLTSYSASAEPEMEISLHRKRSFGSSDKNVLIGNIGNFTVDDRNRVFIADSKQYTIHVLILPALM